MTKTVVILCGPRVSYGFCPVPPVTDSAPERNIFRIAEFDYGRELNIHVISACSPAQKAHFSDIKYYGQYHHIVLPEWLLALQRLRFVQNQFTQRLYEKFCYTRDLFTWIYIMLASKKIKELNPDVILINSLPQYIRLVRHHFPRTSVGLFVRGEMGSSRSSLPLVDFVLTNSAGMAEYVSGLVSDSPVPVQIIHNSLELSYTEETNVYDSGKNRRKVVYTGRIVKVKGVLELLRAYHKVQQRFPDSSLTVVGGNYYQGPLSEYEKEVLTFATTHELNVEFCGHVSNNETPAILLESSIAVFPSIWLESFGMVALEAMRCGLPVIASRRPGFEELVVDGETGILIDDPEDIDSIAHAIIELIQSPEKARKMGEAGYSRSLEFTPEIMNNRFKQIILMVLSENAHHEQ